MTCIAIIRNDKKWKRCPNNAVKGKCYCSSHKWRFFNRVVLPLLVFFLSFFGTRFLNKCLDNPPKLKLIDNIHGYVTIENTDNIGIDSAKVFIVGNPSICDFTDKSGYYNIKIPKKYQDTIYTIIIQKENYRFEEKTINKSKLLNKKDIDIILRPQ